MTKLTAADLAAETVELLPDRDTLVTAFSFNRLNLNWAHVDATNTSTALQAFTIHSNALSSAEQNIAVLQ